MDAEDDDDDDGGRLATTDIWRASAAPSRNWAERRSPPCPVLLVAGFLCG